MISRKQESAKKDLKGQSLFDWNGSLRNTMWNTGNAPLAPILFYLCSDSTDGILDDTEIPDGLNE